MFHLDRKLVAPVAAVLLAAGLSPLRAQSSAVGAVTVTVTSSANPATFGAPLTFTVAVTPAVAAPVPTGTVTATLSGTYILGSATLDSIGRSVIAVPPVSPATIVFWGLGAGSNAIAFSYSGDTRYGPAQSMFTQWIDKADTTTTAAVIGSAQPLRLSATVSIKEPSVTPAGFSLPGNPNGSAPSGTVQFFNGATLLGTATLSPSGLFTSTASIASVTVPADLIAVYAGDANYNGSTSSGTVQGGPRPVTLTLISSANPSVFAEPVTLSIAAAPATAGGPVPTGSVTASILGLFGLGTVTLDAHGQGSLVAPAASNSAVLAVPWGFAAGSNSVSLSFSGDSNYQPAQATFAQVVDKAATSTKAVASSAGPGVTAIVSIAEPSATPVAFALPGTPPGSTSPTGSVQFLSGSTVIGTATLSPSSHLQSTATLTLTASALAAGDIVAVYAGDANYNGSASPATPPVQETAAITATSSANPATFAEPVTFAVAVVPAVAGGPTPAGTVHAVDFGSYPIGDATLDASGRASFTAPQNPASSTAPPWGLATGSNAITVTYSGDATYSPAQTNFNQLVNKADSATTVLLAPVASSPNFYTVVATVSIHEASVASTAFVIPAAGNLSTSPTGNVVFFSGDTQIQTVALTPGALFESSAVLRSDLSYPSIRAVYYGDTNYNGSSSPTSTNGGAPVNITLAASANPVMYGAAFTIAATVTPSTGASPAPTGTLTFYDGAQKLGWVATLNSSGSGSMPIPAPLATPLVCAPACPSAEVMVLGAGQHAITAQYSGDANYAAATAATPLTVNITKAPSVTTLAESCAATTLSQCLAVATVADGQPPAGGPYRFMLMGASGLVDGNPSGSVQFFGGGFLTGTASLSPNAAANVASNASLSTTNGSTSFSALYGGDANFQGSRTPQPSATSVSLSSNPNPSKAGLIVLTASVSPVTATGSVDFLEGTTLLGRGPISGGLAALAVLIATPGAYSLTATYSGDANGLPSSSAVYTQVVLPAAAPAVLSLTASSSAPVYGQPVTLFAQVSGNGTAPPTGAVSFLDGTVAIGSGTLSPGAAYAIVALPVGTHQISAVWGGDANWAPATSAVLSLTVSRASTVTTMTSTLAIAVTAQPPGAGTPTGTVQLVDSGNRFVLATVTLNGGSAQGKALDDPSTDPGGNGVLQAVYSGDTNFAPSTSNLLPVIVNAGGVPTSTLAPDEIATIYGGNLASATVTAQLPLSTSLTGASVTVTDSAGTSRPAPLYYVSPNQINFVVPTGTASGPATVAAGGTSIAISVTAVAPGLFAGAQVVRVHSDGTQAIETVSGPIVFGSDSVYLVLYATGIRHRSSLDQVNCSAGSLSTPVTYAGPQSQYPGLDQVVVPLPAGWQGLGPANLSLTADGQSSNSISLTFQ